MDGNAVCVGYQNYAIDFVECDLRQFSEQWTLIWNIFDRLNFVTETGAGFPCGANPP